MIEPQIEKLIYLLQEEIKLISKLSNALIEEKEALSKRDFTHMQNLAIQKDSLSAELEEAAKTKNLLLNVRSPHLFKEAFNAYINKIQPGDAERITTLNNELSIKLNICRELNMVNGQVISANLTSRREIVDILTGKDRSAAINTYSASGGLKTHSEAINHQEA